MGEIMNVEGITNRIFRLANSLVGHIRGGLAHVIVVVSMIFAGMCGSSMAEAAGLRKIGITGMKRKGFSASFADVSIDEYTREALPFIVTLIAILFLITYVPWLVVGMPNLLMGASPTS